MKMRDMLKTLTLVALLAACGGKGSSTATISSTATASSTFELGEITVFEGKDPMLKIHADGTTELGYRHGTLSLQPGRPASSDALPVSWQPGPKVKTDGTLESAGQGPVRLGADGTVTAEKDGTTQVLALKVNGDRVVVDARSGSVTLSLGADGIVKLPADVKVPAGEESRVAGADTPGKRRLVLTFMGMLLLPGEVVQSPTATAAPTPEPSVTWKAHAVDDAARRGEYALSGFPAVSADGKAVLFAVLGGDLHTTHLELVVANLDNKVVSKLAFQDLVQGGRPADDQMQRAAKFLHDSQATYRWQPLALSPVTLRDDDERFKKTSAQGFDIEATIGKGVDDGIHITKSGKVVVDHINLWKARLSGTESRPSNCGQKQPILGGIAFDVSHSLVVTQTHWVSRDGCYPDDDYSVNRFDKP
jgi:hypothetical protein